MCVLSKSCLRKSLTGLPQINLKFKVEWVDFHKECKTPRQKLGSFHVIKHFVTISKMFQKLSISKMFSYDE